MEEKVKVDLGPNVNGTVISEAATKKNNIPTLEPGDRDPKNRRDQVWIKGPRS